LQTDDNLLCAGVIGRRVRVPMGKAKEHDAISLANG
jgi:hypothetical protein